MSTAPSQQAALEAEVLSAPRQPRRQAPAKRLLTARCCLVSVMTLASIIGIVAVVVVARVAVGTFHNVTTPYISFAHRPSPSSPDEDLVRPLIDSHTHFDIRATVWLDVTQHLKQSKSLSPDTSVVHYTHTSGEQRSEAILYSELLFTNASMQTQRHSTVQIRVPVEPFYSQQLGPSTLRATFQLVPRTLAAELQFKTHDTIYPLHLLVGPRSPYSPLIKQSGTQASLDHALDRSGINVNLVTLLATKWRLNSTQHNLRDDYGIEPAMFDGSPSNRVFMNATEDDLYIGDQHRIMLPHVKTRSRIILLKADHNFTTPTYTAKQAAAKQSLDKACASMKHKPLGAPADGKCQRPTNDAVFENVLHFTNSTSSKEQLYYGPFLFQQSAASAQRHHRTIPRSRPTYPTAEKVDRANACLVPMLQTDDSLEYFEFDLDVFFSSHHHLRASAAESLVHTYEPALQDYIENGTEIRAQMSTVSDMQWSLQAFGLADREHPKSRPWSIAWRLVIFFSMDAVPVVLSTLYWYTRSTSQGLSFRAQWLYVATLGMSLVGHLMRIKDTSWSLWQAVYQITTFGSTLVPALLEAIVLLRLDITSKGITRQPLTKKQRLSRRIDERYGWTPCVLLFLTQMAYTTLSTPESTRIIPAIGCYEPPQPDFAPSSLANIFAQTTPALRSSAILSQLLFNFASGTYAGSFKLAAFANLALWSSMWTLERSERLSGWHANRASFSLADLAIGLARFVFVAQAVLLPGIPQGLTEGEDDDNL